MQRYFSNEALEVNQQIQLEKDDNHHIVRVMRGKVDDEVIIVDSTNIAYKAKIEIIEDNVANLRIINALENQQTELPIQVTIACGLSKNDKIDLIVQKATECGMNEFIPLALERDVVKWKGNKISNRIERLERISKEAAEQCHRNVIPEISHLSTIDTLQKEAGNYKHKLIAYEETAKKGQHGQLKETLKEVQAGDNLIIVFGSEGGLTELEVAKLKEVGYIECSLGPRILRAETAPIYALSAMSYHLEV
ncbi:16S rRNA (uracil(1498)-N(3))-methyltransferase [Ruoffia tabacinasalis]|uniref:Ribosomal RNA small subunit methyltransferase E n=1 Tax=Ruoffia tabacinasalis TaxID=87458 RepID=A0ABS0LHZ3_9LACT|nr:16S rRNA (uracil(1498)-N(3))-methyltransferase [Ruoffia tabacinasalis]MBG9977829.1 16S rRNA (uracil(1498)-N(3))-methyltransferase [Ruoffia tabacinasalis]